MLTAGPSQFCSFDEPCIKLTGHRLCLAGRPGRRQPASKHGPRSIRCQWRDPWEADFVVGEDYIVCRRVDRTAFLRNVQRIAECIVHFFLIEELVAEDDQLVIVD